MARRPGNRWRRSLAALALLVGSPLAASCSDDGTGSSAWPRALDPLSQPPVADRTVNGTRHVLRAPIRGPIPPRHAEYEGPTDWQGNPAVGDAYVDSLNFDALATCETGEDGGDPKGFNPDDDDAGGARYGAFQTAKVTWHYAVDLDDAEQRDPYQDPRDAPLWYQTYRDKRKTLKELVRGPDDAWRYPPETHHRSCGEELFSDRPAGAPARIYS
jgi:hypothetical protein